MTTDARSVIILLYTVGLDTHGRFGTSGSHHGKMKAQMDVNQEAMKDRL
jgi:hypothetical protein